MDVGEVQAGLTAAESLRNFNNPPVDVIEPMPYVALQQMLDPGMPFGIREYFKIDWLGGLPDEAIDVASKHPMAWAGAIELRPFWPDGED